MAHFAELDENNVVLRVIVVNDSDCIDENGNESEAVGSEFCSNLLGGRWIKTSYNGNIRKRYAGEGFTYDEQNDVFIRQQPFASWTLDENFEWQPPVPKPFGPQWMWSEEQQGWISS